ncbi:PREDICTED: cap-specific mRNA (nucleoside-2'-O-)-methyltransferase 2-like [Priapulus caudatus]|uniref:Cap-specific mRNA (nucleoside-2'-O-)-methyltransferase 2 n=1 Tax=Priapulus caudatus TaxID=37621 RepID=A0ABM1EFZ9_PRICU|nr:PREDICTED: cap-specific mRNA (nucleoside-2'-O-)-methyltransferase 2-like [Priapulus caudatus]
MEAERRQPKRSRLDLSNHGHKEKDIDIQSQVDSLFGKKFVFNGGEWSLPPSSILFTSAVWQIEALQTMKRELNELKDRLSDKDIIEWGSHTAQTNKAGAVLWHLRKYFRAELCTQAWAKLHEILCGFPLVPRGGAFNSLHLCEAPGAFVTSLNHYVRTRAVPVEWTWLATTLNPFYEGNKIGCMIDDDRSLMIHTLDNWYFGKDNTGDVMSEENLAGLINHVKSGVGGIHLVTADGSINCQHDPAEQEHIVSPLHFCEVVTALHLLVPSGGLVVKLFTMFEHASVCLLYLLCNVFQKVSVVKPATSKAGNSEVYVVCLSYEPPEQFSTFLEALRAKFGPDSTAEPMFPLSALPEGFLSQVIDCCTLFTSHQIKEISRNLRLFRNPEADESRESLEAVRHGVASRFIVEQQLMPMTDAQRVVPHLNQRIQEFGCSYQSKGKRLLTGTYRERLGKQSLWRETASQLVRGLEGKEQQDLWYWLQPPCRDLGETDLELVTGRQLTRVVSTKFCDPVLIELLDDALSNSAASQTAVDSGSWIPEFASSLCQALLLSTPDCVELNYALHAGGGKADTMFLTKLKQELGKLVKLRSDRNQAVETGVKTCSKKPGEGCGTAVSFDLSPAEAVAGDTPAATDVSAAKLTRYCDDPGGCHSDGKASVKPYLLLRDVTSDAKVTGEVDAMDTLLKCALNAVEVLPPGGAMVLCMYDMLTRMNVGMLYIFQHIFEKVGVYKPVATSVGGSRVLVCAGYRGCPGYLLHHMQAAAVLTSQLTQGHQVLQLVAMSCLLEKYFYNFVCDMNDNILLRRLQALMADDLQTC